MKNIEILNSQHTVPCAGSYSAISLFPDNYRRASLSDAPFQAGDDIIVETMAHRRLPGDGNFDLVSDIRQLDACGSEAPIGVEVFSTDLAKLPPEQNGEISGRCARRIIDLARR